ncbi:MAG: DUF6166 domain-containing protein [Pseudomonadota bacterium]
MKEYQGQRTIDGIKVTVDGEPLAEYFDVHTYDDKGFEWSYVGTAPRQLALAILVDHFQDPEKAKSKVEAFTEKIIADLDNDWILTSEQIAAVFT